MWSDLELETGDGERLAGSWTGDPAAPRVVVAFSGFGGQRLNSNNTQVAARLDGKGWAVVAVDLSGHGDSSGDIRHQTLSRAAAQISDVVGLVRQRWSSARIAIMGNSFSASATLLALSTGLDVDAVALKSPVADYVEMRTLMLGAEGMATWLREGTVLLPFGEWSDVAFLKDAQAIDIYSAVEQTRCPLLAVHGSEDEGLSRSAQVLFEEAVRRAGHQYVLMEGADHVLSDPHFAPAVETFSTFLDEALSIQGMHTTLPKD